MSNYPQQETESSIRPIYVCGEIDGEFVRDRIWAVVFDDGLAVHRSIWFSESNRRGYRLYHDRYTITHVASGLAFYQGLDRDGIGAALEDARRLTWRNIPLYQMPVCEILNNSDLINRDLVPGWKSTRHYDKVRRGLTEFICGKETAVS